MKDIPEKIEKEQKKFSEVEFCYAKNIGADERIAQITRERIEDAVNSVKYTKIKQFLLSCYHTR